MFASRMKKLLASILVPALLGAALAFGQTSGLNVFAPISKYLASGDVESLSAWFAPTLEISLPGIRPAECSGNQAEQILKTFFKTHVPRSFAVTHQAGRDNMKYALGVLNAGGEMFNVTIFVIFKNGAYKIQQLSIERI